MGSVQTVAPTTTAISLDDAKDHLRVDDNQDDSYITTLIKTATLSVEEFARRALIHQTRRLDIPAFCDEMILEYPPLVSVDAITYTAADGTTGTSLASSAYDVDTANNRVLLAYDESWPTVQAKTFDAVQITYTVGYSSISSGVPANYQHAIKLLIDRFYDDRSEFKTGTIVSSLPWGVKELVRPTRNYRYV